MTVYTFVHVLLSLIGIASGLLMLYGFLTDHAPKNATTIFLVTTAATVLTGFGFPFKGFTPALGVGLLCSLLLAVAIASQQAFRLTGIWRSAFVIAAVASLYFNVFVLIVQAFQKIPALHALAPTGSEPPFAAAQGATLIGFVIAGTLSVKRFHPRPI
jgi:hypothetical protein